MHCVRSLRTVGVIGLWRVVYMWKAERSVTLSDVMLVDEGVVVFIVRVLKGGDMVFGLGMGVYVLQFVDVEEET